MQESCRVEVLKLEVHAAPLGGCRVLLPRLFCPQDQYRRICGRGTQTLTFKAKDSSPWRGAFCWIGQGCCWVLTCMPGGWVEAWHLKPSFHFPLLFSGCDVNSPRQPGANGEGEEEARDGQTPLHLAASWGLEETVQCLLEFGANVNAQVWRVSLLQGKCW